MMFDMNEIIYSTVFLVYFFTCFFHFKWFFTYICAKRMARLSSNCLINFGAWFFASISGMIYMSYMFYCNGEMANGHIIFWASLSYVSLSTLVSSTVAFMLLDRMFVLLAPAVHFRSRPKFMFLSILCCLIIAGVAIPMLGFQELPVEPIVPCQSSAVLKHKFGLPITAARVLLGVVNLFLLIMFLMVYYMHKTASKNTNREFRRANQLTMVASVLELIFTSIPYTSYFFYRILSTSATLKSVFLGGIFGSDSSGNGFSVPLQIVLVGAKAFFVLILYFMILRGNPEVKVDADTATRSGDEQNEQNENTNQNQSNPAADGIEVIELTSCDSAPPSSPSLPPRPAMSDNYMVERPYGRYNNINLSQI